MTVTEATARLEAKLRGWTICPECSDTGYSGNVPEFYLATGHNCERATDPATAEGAWEWVRLLQEKRDYRIELSKYGYVIREPWPAGTWSSKDKQVAYGPGYDVLAIPVDPIAAVAAAVEALAESEASR